MNSLKAAISEGKETITQDNFDQSKQYVKRMTGVLDGLVLNPKSGLHMFKCRVNGTPKYTQAEAVEDIETIIAKIELIVDTTQREFDEKYGTSALSEYIKRCDEMLDERVLEEDAIAFCYEVSGAYCETIPGYKDFLDFFIIGTPTPKEHIPIIKAKLKAHRDGIVQKANTAPQQTFNTHATAQSSAIAQAAVTFEQTIQKVDEIRGDVLSEEEKDELKKLLFDVKESQKKDKVRFLKAAKVVADWVFAKGIEAIPFVLTYIAQTAQLFN